MIEVVLNTTLRMVESVMIEVVLNTTLRLLRESYDRVCIEYYTDAIESQL